ncbi:hypothetical protein Tco_0622778, partial [Tanacetum coccineum]
RAHIMIKAIDKQVKERRMMRSLEKFVGGRHYVNTFVPMDSDVVEGSKKAKADTEQKAVLKEQVKN